MEINHPPPQRLLIYSNPGLAGSETLAGQIMRWLQEHGIECTNSKLYDESTQQSPIAVNQYDGMIVLGGDGSLLRAGHIGAPLGIPLLGINLGKFGFLTEIQRDEWQEKLIQLLAGRFRVEERMMLNAEFYKSGEFQQKWDVINEVVVCRGQYVRPIELRVTMNDGYLTSYVADGLIASTATGSTAYALAAGGPILPPELRNILLMPIAPHLSLDRAVILDEGTSVCISVRSRHETVVSVDGMDPISMGNDDQVKVTANNNSLKMIRFADRGYFYRNLALYMENNPISGIKDYEQSN